ncbi:MAG TPA: hypothetical protein P5232_04585 [Candidatus Moranbacteria bacterium]|nr:hypothetical protein [Candidatus Moranbacteria bacterium]
MSEQMDLPIKKMQRIELKEKNSPKIVAKEKKEKTPEQLRADLQAIRNEGPEIKDIRKRMRKFRDNPPEQREIYFNPKFPNEKPIAGESNTDQNKKYLDLENKDGTRERVEILWEAYCLLSKERKDTGASERVRTCLGSNCKWYVVKKGKANEVLEAYVFALMENDEGDDYNENLEKIKKIKEKLKNNSK